MRGYGVLPTWPLRRHRYGATAVALLGVLAAACGSDVLAGPEDAASPAVAEFVDLVNAHRETVGCPALAWNASVTAVAQAHSVDMMDRDYFSHTSPDGLSPFDRLAEAGIAYSGAAENIAYGYATPEAVLAAWLGSTGHKANIENCTLTEHGVGLDGTYWTHVFIRP